jgi:hypothetical protein
MLSKWNVKSVTGLRVTDFPAANTDKQISAVL